MKNKAIILHHDYKDIFSLLSDEESGKLLKALFLYDVDGYETIFDERELNLVFLQVKKSLDANREHYEETCRKRAESASKRWEKREEKAKEKEEESRGKTKKKMQLHANADNTNANANANLNASANVNANENANENASANSNVNVNANENARESSLHEKREEAPLQEKTQTQKVSYGEFQNVFLTDKEYRSLSLRFDDLSKRIDSFSAYMKSSGKTYADHYAQLINWRLFATADSTPKGKKPPGERREPTFDISEFTKKAIGIKYVPPKE